MRASALRLAASTVKAQVLQPSAARLKEGLGDGHLDDAAIRVLQPRPKLEERGNGP